MKYSLIIPVYNRPDEVAELLESMTRQTETDFEVIVVEDGSTVSCESVCRQYATRLRLQYCPKPNSGPGPSRNYGVGRAQGEYVIVLDSDVVLPDGYLAAVSAALDAEPADAFGGPDAAHPDFTPVQKAISYSMTSFFTTGGIRGGRKEMDKFYPRSFNMGVRRTVYQKLGGFSTLRFGEDIDFSIRLIRSGAKTRLIPEAWVWHKRRTDFRKFFRQVFNSGMARINLYKRYPDTLKLVHLLPAVFTAGSAALILISAVGRVLMHYDDPHRWYWLCAGPWLPLLLFALLIAADATRAQRSLKVGLLAVGAAFVQLTGYGCGFLRAWWERCVLRRKEEGQAFKETFYK